MQEVLTEAQVQEVVAEAARSLQEREAPQAQAQAPQGKTPSHAPHTTRSHTMACSMASHEATTSLGRRLPASHNA